MSKSPVPAIVALGTVASILAFAVGPVQAKLTEGPLQASPRFNATPSMPPLMVVDPDQLFRYEPRPVLWAGESNPVRDCIYDGRCGTIAIDAEHGCG